MLRRRATIASVALLVAFVSMRPVATNALHGCTALTEV